MTPEQRLDRVERMLRLFVRAGRRTREEWNYKVNCLIDAQIKNEAAWRAESQAINEQIKATDEQIRATNEQIKNVAVAQAELTKSQKLTQRALRDFISSLRKNQNGR